MVTWDECCHAFEPDGDLRDIRIHRANAAVWDAALPFLVSQGLSTFRVDGDEVPLPPRPRDVLRLRPGASAALIGKRDGIQYACHFFSEDDVGITFPPFEVDGPGRFASLLSFVRGLGQATGRDVLVTYGDGSDEPFLHYALAADDFPRVEGADRAGLKIAPASDSRLEPSTGRARWPAGRAASRGSSRLHDMQEDLDLVMKAAAIIKRDVEAFMADTDAMLDALAARVAALEAWRSQLERAGPPRGQPPARRRLRPVVRSTPRPQSPGTPGN